MEPRSATLISDQDRQFIDHLAPISELLRIPMIVNDEEIESLIKTYYPRVKLLYQTSLELGSFIASHFEIIYTCLPNPLFQEIVFAGEILNKKKLLNVWCPHGNSDKGHQGDYIESLSHEKRALVYGKKLINLLIEKGSFDQLDLVLITGNYRYNYYLKNKLFYQKKLSDLIKLNSNKTILYAPTWRDCESSSSFDSAIKLLIETLPDHLNLIIKPHPNLFSSPELFELHFYQYEKKKNVAILSDFPPIYPLLDFVDIYLGDMSSIGYDFLTFRKPMFFLNTNKRNPKTDKGLYLTRCGILIEPENYMNVYSIIEKTDPKQFINNQVDLYDDVFGKEENIKEKVEKYYAKQLQPS